MYKPTGNDVSVMKMLFPDIDLTGPAQNIGWMAASLLNEFYGNPTNGMAGDLGAYMRPEPLKIFGEKDARLLHDLIKQRGHEVGLQVGDCAQLDVGVAPVSPDRAKNVPVAFSSTTFQILPDGRGKVVSDTSGGQTMSDEFMNDSIEIHQRGMLDHMTRSGQKMAATIQILPAAQCR